MKTLRVILLALALSSLAAPALPANAAPSDSSCGCTCCVLKERQSGTAPVGGSFSVSKIKACGGDKSADTPSVAADDETACISLCGEKEGEYGMRACVKGDCWCKQGENFSFIGQTGSAEQCVTACAEAKLEFGNWGAPPATKTSAVKCPPGGMWTKEECEAQVDTMGEKVGEWLPPSGSDTKGPYCYVLQ